MGSRKRTLGILIGFLLFSGTSIAAQTQAPARKPNSQNPAATRKPATTAAQPASAPTTAQATAPAAAQPVARPQPVAWMMVQPLEIPKEKANHLFWVATEFPIYLVPEYAPPAPAVPGSKEPPQRKVIGSYAQGVLRVRTLHPTLESLAISPDEEKNLVQEQFKKETGDLTFALKIRSEKTRFAIIYIDSKGKAVEGKFQVVVKDWAKAKAFIDRTPPPKRHNFGVSLGGTYISMSQTGETSLSEIGLTIKGMYRFDLVPGRWRLGFNAFFTALALYSSIPDVTARFLGINISGSYILPFVKSPWEIAIALGGYYNRTFVTSDQFGYSALGWTVIPNFSLMISDRDFLSNYIKVAPLGESFSFSFGSMEIASGLSWMRKLKNGNGFSIAVDVSSLSLTVGASQLKVLTTSLSGGYHF